MGEGRGAPLWSLGGEGVKVRGMVGDPAGTGRQPFGWERPRCAVRRGQTAGRVSASWALTQTPSRLPPFSLSLASGWLGWETVFVPLEQGAGAAAPLLAPMRRSDMGRRPG